MVMRSLYVCVNVMIVSIKASNDPTAKYKQRHNIQCKRTYFKIETLCITTNVNCVISINQIVHLTNKRSIHSPPHI